MPRIPAALRRALVVLAAALTVAGSLAAAGAAAGAGGAQDAATRVDILPVSGNIDPPVMAGIREVLDRAADGGAALAVLQVDTPGALSVDVSEIVEVVRASEVPVAVYVGPGLVRAQAAGAGVFLLAAAGVGAVAPDATVGPAVPADVSASGDPGAERAELARLLRDLPQDLDAPAAADLLAGEAVDAERAVELGLAAVVADGLQPLLVDLDGIEIARAGGSTVLRLRPDELDVRLHSLGPLRRILHATAAPTLVYLALAVGLALLLFEAFQPGFGVAGVAALVLLAVAVYGVWVMPVSWWALLALVAGLLLLAVDVAVAGLGVPTAAGAAAFAVGSAFLYVPEGLRLTPWLVGGTTAAALVFFVVVMTIVLRAQAGPDPEAVRALVGRSGVVRSILNPEGHVYIDDALWRARATGGERVTVGTPVRVHGVDGPVVLVEVATDGEKAQTTASTS